MLMSPALAFIRLERKYKHISQVLKLNMRNAKM